jgi:putative ABC transport system substrate-binding protein
MAIMLRPRVSLNQADPTPPDQRRRRAAHGRRCARLHVGADLNDAQRLAASYVDRILSGANPAELPVQAPTKYQTILNLKVARALDFVSPSLLVRADEVIE